MRKPRSACMVLCLGLAFTASRLGAANSVPARPPAESDFCRALDYAGIAVQEKGWHIWGCSPILGKDGKVHLFVERWPVKVPFDIGWRQDSEIARYVSDTPEGPFKFKETVLKGTGGNTWDRFAPSNSHIQEVDGKYVLLHIANANGMTKGIAGHTVSQRIGMAIADSLEGPWRKVGNNGLILSPSDDPKHWTYQAPNGVVNPALLKHPNGKYLLYYKSKAAKMGVAIADKLEGPYIHQPKPITENTTAIEDGYAFASDGKFFFLTTDNFGIREKGGGLLWESADGLSFDQTPKLGFHAAAAYLSLDDPKRVRHYYAARTSQRPQVLLQDGRPTHLYLASGSNPSGGDGSVCFMLKCDLGKGRVAVPLPVAASPYLQNPAPDGMTVCYATRRDTAVRVKWSPASGEKATEMAASAIKVPGTPWTVWKARMNGLQPGAGYQYQLRYTRDGVERETPVRTFLTLDPNAETVRLAAFNDVHSGAKHVTELSKLLKPDDYDFTVLLGDCWNDPGIGDSARVVFNVLDSFARDLNAAEKPMLYVRGNHEFRGNFSRQMAFLFDLPHLKNPDVSATEQSHHFDLRVGPAWFIAMDCGEDNDRAPQVFNPYRERQLGWLKERVAAQAADGKPWRVFLSHIPLYAYNTGCYSEPSRRMWEHTLASAGVDIALAGHDHSWKLVPKGKPIAISRPVRDANQQITGKDSWTITPPYPVMIGGDGRTVMLLEAKAERMQVRMLNAEGKELTTILVTPSRPR